MSHPEPAAGGPSGRPLRKHAPPDAVLRRAPPDVRPLPRAPPDKGKDKGK